MTTYPSRAASVAAAASTTGNEVIEVVQNGALVKAALSADFTIVGGALTAAANTLASQTDGSPATLSDLFPAERSGLIYKLTGTNIATLIRKTPAGSRTASLPAVLTAADMDKNVVLTGTTGNLSVDGTVTDGFRCHVINQASGVATYSGITGLLATTSLASGANCTVMMAGATVYASAGGSTTVSPATAYTTALSATSGTSGTPVTMTFTPTAGSWPSCTITPTVATLTGSFAGTVTGGTISGGVITPTAGSTVPVTIAYTPTSSSGTSGTLNSTASGVTNTTGALTYTISAAAATAYTMTQGATSGGVGTADVLTLTPTSGVWPSGVTITLAVATVTGAFSSGSGGTLSGNVLTPPAGASTACTVNMTPSTSGTATISATNSGSMTNPGSLTYTVSAASTATAYTATQSTVGGTTTAPYTVTLTPNGNWPAGTTISLNATGATNAITNGTGGSLSGSTLTPAAGTATPCTVTITPSASGCVTFFTTNNQSLTKPMPLFHAAGSAGSLTNDYNIILYSGAVFPANFTLTSTLNGYDYGKVTPNPYFSLTRVSDSSSVANTNAMSVAMWPSTTVPPSTPSTPPGLGVSGNGYIAATAVSNPYYQDNTLVTSPAGVGSIGTWYYWIKDNTTGNWSIFRDGSNNPIGIVVSAP